MTRCSCQKLKLELSSNNKSHQDEQKIKQCMLKMFSSGVTCKFVTKLWTVKMPVIRGDYKTTAHGITISSYLSRIVILDLF